jgi:hypothetical protein
MNFHFLVTISDNAMHLFGVRFICSFFDNLSGDCQVTLLHIGSADKNQLSQTLGAMWDDPAGEPVVKLSAGTRKAISTARALLLAKKLTGENVQVKTLPEQYGKTLDILKEAEFGQYDAIVLGRRASYTLQWMFENPADQTAKKIIRSLCSVPVWICPELDPTRKNVLLCLDGSENSLRAADHVGYILTSEPHQAITLFHVEATDEGSSSDIFNQAEALLHEHHIDGRRITRKSVRGRNSAGLIQSEVNRGGFAAVALGLHGTQEHMMKQQNITGSTITRIISSMEKAAIWICP